MRRAMLIFVVVAISACRGEVPSAVPADSHMVFRTLSVCELAFAAGNIAKGSHLPSTAQRRQLVVTEALKGARNDLVYPGDSKVGSGAAFVFLWTLGTSTQEVMGQGVFREIQPGIFANNAAYRGGARANGSHWGGISEADLRTEIQRGMRASSLADCRSPVTVREEPDSGV